MKNKRKAVNIINFVRGCEPRCDIDLIEPVKEQLALLKKYNFPGTFLLQYDALINPEFTALFKDADNSIDIGVWLEIVQPQVEAAGLNWRGRYPWDWHANVGFTVGYTLEEREKLIDVLFQKFKEIFGYYPNSMGSWIIDAHTLKYAHDKYGIVASCNCRDQFGTDGYSLWGGYYNQAYYPSKNNVFCPASTKECQIDVPVFRMLGPDPLRQYDIGLDISTGPAAWQAVYTLETIYDNGGGNSEWVDWYFSETFSDNCLNFANAQVGQENSFGWPSISKGLTYQLEALNGLRNEGKLQIETLADTAKWFKNSFSLTPATTLCALNPYDGDERQTVWYNCRNYRINLIVEESGLRIRDIHRFYQDCLERYRNKPCNTESLQFNNMPIVDGNRFTGHGILAGIVPMIDGKHIFGEIKYNEDLSEDTAIVEVGKLRITMQPKGVTFEADSELSLSIWMDKQAKCIPEILVKPDMIDFKYDGFNYNMPIICGKAERGENIEITSQNGRIKLMLS